MKSLISEVIINFLIYIFVIHRCFGFQLEQVSIEEILGN